MLAHKQPFSVGLHTKASSQCRNYQVVPALDPRHRCDFSLDPFLSFTQSRR